MGHTHYIKQECTYHDLAKLNLWGSVLNLQTRFTTFIVHYLFKTTLDLCKFFRHPNNSYLNPDYSGSDLLLYYFNFFSVRSLFLSISMMA